MKLSKPFRRQFTHYAEKLLHELLSNISLIKCPTPIGSTKIRALTSCVRTLAQYSTKISCHVEFLKILVINVADELLNTRKSY